MILEVLLSFVVLLLISQVPKLFEILRKVKLAADVPGPPCLPIIGCIHKMPHDLHEVPTFMHQCAEEALAKGAHLMKFWIGPWLAFLPLDHEASKAILNSTVEITKGEDYKLFEKWLGPGLLLGDGERWHRTRKLVTPAFHFSKIAEYAQSMDIHARTLIGLLDEKADDDVVDLYPFIKLCALDIIADTTMGVCLNAQRTPQHPYVQAVEKFNYYSCYRSLHLHLRPDIMWKWFGYEKETDEAVDVLHSFTNRVIKERREIFKEDQQNRDVSVKNRPNFLDLMLALQDSEEQLSNEHLRQEVDTIMFAGHDTSAHAVSWLSWVLATHPEIQERVYEEIISHFGHSDSEFGTTRVKELKFLDQCFKETLRLYSPVPAIQRRVQNDLEVCNRTVPGGTTMTIPLILIHRNPNTFKDPMKFDPSRFEDEKKIPPFAFTPFSAGLRNCIGQKFANLEAKVVIAHLLYNFKLETDLKLEANTVLFEVVLRPTLGVPVRLTRRDH